MLFLGWYDIVTSHNVKSTLKWRCVCRRWDLQPLNKVESKLCISTLIWTMLDNVKIWYGKTRVTSCELQVESLKARVESLKTQVKIQKCEFQSTSYEFQFKSYEFKSTSYEFNCTSYEFRSTSYEFKLTSPRIIKSMKTQVNSFQISTRN